MDGDGGSRVRHRAHDRGDSRGDDGGGADGPFPGSRRVHGGVCGGVHRGDDGARTCADSHRCTRLRMAQACGPAADQPSQSSMVHLRSPKAHAPV